MPAACEFPITEKSPLVLFAKLELAVMRGDHATAAEIQRSLAELGVVVRFGLPGAAGKAVSDGR